MLAGSSPNRLTIKKGGVTMRVPNSDIEARVSALEAYVDIPTMEHNGTTVTVTGRLEAQHKLLTAIQIDYTDFRAEFNAFREETNRRLSALEERVAALEDMMGQVLHGMTEIKRLLMTLRSDPP
jgi:hypothetical protein